MFRMLGELVVFLGIGATAAGVAVRKLLMPALRRRHTARLERENAELDRQLNRMKGE